MPEIKHDVVQRRGRHQIKLPNGSARVRLYYDEDGKVNFEMDELYGTDMNSLATEDMEALAHALLKLARELKYPQGITALQGV